MQVAMMDQVYRNSSMNLIRLADIEGDTLKSLTAIEAVVADMRRETKDFKYTRLTMFGWSERLKYSNTGLPADIDWDSLLKFYQHEWFHRLWMVQEAALSKKSIVYCGSLEVPLLDTLRCAVWLKRNRYHLPFAFEDYPGLQKAASMWALCDWSLLQQTYRDSLPDLLFAYEGFGCTNKRDYIFALLGLTRHITGEGGGSTPGAWAVMKKLLHLVQPDYEKPEKDVWRDATLFVTQVLPGSLEVLRYVNRRSSPQPTISGLPSWVPSWDQVTPDVSLLPDYFVAYPRSLRKTEFEGPFEVFHQPEDPDILGVYGLLFATVSQTSRTMTAQTLYDPVEVLDLLPSITDMATNALSDSKSTLEAVAYTLITGTNSNNRSATASDIAGYDAFLDYIRTTGSLPHLVPDSELAVLNEKPDAHPPANDAAHYRNALRTACLNRTFFVTAGLGPHGERGGRQPVLGVGPREMQECDTVLLLRACHYPIITRKSEEDGWHRIIGPAYVHRIMQGEGFKQCRKMGRKDEVFWFK
jgi:hypothetical protein